MDRFGQVWIGYGQDMDTIWGKYGNGKTVAKKRQNVGIDKNFFIFFRIFAVPISINK